MRLNRLDLNLLVALDALLTEQSITKAADRIHLSQSATSGALARLRDYFEDELLVRVGSKMQRTLLGESLTGPVHNILLQIQATVERGVEFDPKQSERKFKFVLTDYACSTLMTHLVRKLEEVAPKMQLEFLMPTDSVATELEKGRVDFLLMPDAALSKSLPSEPLFSDDFVCLTAADNKTVGDEIDYETYLSIPQVSLRFGESRTRTQADHALEYKYKISLDTPIIASTFANVPEYLIGTQRIATIYRRLAKKWCNYLPLKYVEIPQELELPTITWCLQWHEYRDLDPDVIWMRKLIKSIVAEQL